MEELDNIVKTIQSKALAKIYMDLGVNNNSIRERVIGYLESIDIINKYFQTHYDSGINTFQKIAKEAKTLKDCVLQSPLKITS